MRLIGVRTRSGLYGPEAMAIATTAARLVRRGVDVRRLRILQQSGTAHAALLEQIFEGYPRDHGPSLETVQEMLQVLNEAHNAYLHGKIAGSRWYRGIHDRS